MTGEPPRLASTRPSVAPQVVDAFVAECFRAFEQNGPTADRVLMADRVVEVRWAAPALRERFMPALRHLLVEESSAAVSLTVCCWDGATTTRPLPEPPWPRADFVGGSRIRGHITGPVVATYDADGRLFQLSDRPRSRALLHVAGARRLLDWHDRSPFRQLLSLWAEDAGLALLHGSTVGSSGHAVVLAGRSGSGKSTSAMACVAAGMDFLGDDACLVDPTGPRVASMYGRAKLEPDAARWLVPSLVLDKPVESDRHGATLLSPPGVLASAALSAVLLVSVGRRVQTTLSEPVPRSEARDALADSLSEENKGLRPAAVEALAAVVDAVPVRHLEVGTDVERLVAAVRRALS